MKSETVKVNGIAIECPIEGGQSYVAVKPEAKEHVLKYKLNGVLWREWEAIAFPILKYFNFLSTMPKSKKNQSAAKHSAGTLTPTGATSVQVIHQLVIPEKPSGLIGEKVVYNEKYLKRVKNPDEYLSLIPKCGYFIITKAVLLEDGCVMVALYPWPSGRSHFWDGTHICVGNMKKYKP